MMFEYEGNVTYFEDRVKSVTVDKDIIQSHIIFDEFKPITKFTKPNIVKTNYWAADIESYLDENKVHVAYCFCLCEKIGYEVVSYHQKDMDCVFKGLLEIKN